MINRFKMELINLGLKFMNIDDEVDENTKEDTAKQETSDNENEDEVEDFADLDLEE